MLNTILTLTVKEAMLDIVPLLREELRQRYDSAVGEVHLHLYRCAEVDRIQVYIYFITPAYMDTTAHMDDVYLTKELAKELINKYSKSRPTTNFKFGRSRV